MKHLNFLLLLVCLLFSLFLLSCSGGGSKQTENDVDLDIAVDADSLDTENTEGLGSDSYNEYLPPYCEDETVYKQVSDLPLTKDVDCSAQCNARLKCEWEWAGEPTDTADYQRMIGLCITDCGRIGSWDYAQFTNCADMKTRINELTMETVDTSTWAGCKPPQSEEDWEPNTDNPCYSVCDALLRRCSVEVKNFFADAARGEGVTDMMMCMTSCQGKYESVNYAMGDDPANNLACSDVAHFLMDSWKWPPEKKTK